MWFVYSTWRNAQLGERIILQMENKSKEMAEEMNKTIEKLNVEASALEEEKEKKSVSFSNQGTIPGPSPLGYCPVQ